MKLVLGVSAVLSMVSGATLLVNVTGSSVFAGHQLG